MKKLIITLSYFTMSLLCCAQVNIQWSDLSFSKTTFYQEVFLDDHIYMVKVNTNGFTFSKKNNTAIYKYDANLKKVKETYQALKYGKQKAVFFQIASH